jgi:hypothetical protein
MTKTAEKHEVVSWRKARATREKPHAVQVFLVNEFGLDIDELPTSIYYPDAEYHIEDGEWTKTDLEHRDELRKNLSENMMVVMLHMKLVKPRDDVFGLPIGLARVFNWRTTEGLFKRALVYYDCGHGCTDNEKCSKARHLVYMCLTEDGEAIRTQLIADIARRIEEKGYPDRGGVKELLLTLAIEEK